MSVAALTPDPASPHRLHPEHITPGNPPPPSPPLTPTSPFLIPASNSTNHQHQTTDPIPSTLKSPQEPSTLSSTKILGPFQKPVPTSFQLPDIS